MVVRGGRVRPLAIFANFFEAGDLWPPARVFYGENEISVRMSSGIYRRVCSAVSRRTVLHPNADDATPVQRPPRTLLSILAHHPAGRLHHAPHEGPLARGRDPAQSPRQQRTRSRIVADGPCRGDAHLYRASCGLGGGRKLSAGGSGSLSYKLTRSHRSYSSRHRETIEAARESTRL